MQSHRRKNCTNPSFFLTSLSAVFSWVSAACVIFFAQPFIRLWVGSEFLAGPVTMRTDTVAIVLMLAALPGMIQISSRQLVFASGQLSYLARLEVMSAS